MSRTFDFLFYPKKPKDYVSGPVKLYLRITIDGKRSETATALNINPDKWESGKMKGNKEDAKAFNTYLDTLKTQIYDCHKNLLQSGGGINADSLRNAFTGRGERPQFLIEIFKAHNANIEKLIGKDYAKPTLTKYITTLNHLANFLNWKYKASDIDLGSLKYEFLSDFEFYLKTQKNIDHNTTAKYIKNTKKVVNDCLAKGWLKTNPFGNFKITTKVVDRCFLSEEELDILTNKEFKIQRISQVRDIFVFSCYTGLSFIDVANLTPNHIATGMDWEKWIFTSRQKTDTPSHIPLLAPALDIIEKYKDHPAAVNKGRLLPMLSNQKMNAYLKEIADLCGINKYLTFHVARHNFATTVTLTNGVPIESVSKMLGHKKLQTTQHYAKILDKKVSNDMDSLRNKYKAKLKVVSKKISGS
ncbi:MAG: recombinase [Ferruginibacter sp.]|nr:recombinase [Ferruginibacter sp.]